MAYSPLTLTKTTLSSIAVITKAADGDAAGTIAHNLGVIPDEVNVCAVSGTEAAWRVAAVDATNVSLVSSGGGGTAASTCKLVAKINHSIVK